MVFAFFSLLPVFPACFAPQAREGILSVGVVNFVYLCSFLLPLCFCPLRRLRRHLPRTRGRLPSQSRRPCGRLASSPGGRAKCTPVGKGKLCGKTKFLLLSLTTNFAKMDAGTLASPRGGGGTALCAVTERGGPHVYGGAVERSETERAKSWPQRSDQTKKKSAC